MRFFNKLQVEWNFLNQLNQPTIIKKIRRERHVYDKSISKEERRKDINERYKSNNPKIVKINSIRNLAHARGLDWQLTNEEVWNMINQNCGYCNTAPKMVDGRKGFNGIDRINNDIGYYKSNCIAACWRCNRSKGAISFELIRSMYKVMKRNKEENK